MLKHIGEIEFPYWFKKRVSFDLYYKVSECDMNKKALVLSIWEYHKIPELGNEYKDEWFTNWWKHITLWKNYKKSK